MKHHPDITDFRRPALRLSFLVPAVALLGALFVAAAMYEVRRSRRDVLTVLSRDAATLIESVELSGANALHAMQEVAISREQDLLRIARLMRDLDSSGSLASDRMADVSGLSGAGGLMLFDRAGHLVRVFPASLSELVYNGSFSPVDLAPVLEGKEEEDVISREGRVFVVVARNSGGALVLTDEEQPLDLRRSIGIGRLVQDIGDNPGIEYLVLQDDEGIILSSGGVVKMPRLIGDPFLVEAIADDSTRTRTTSYTGRDVLEAVRSFHADDASFGLLRVGLSMDAVRNAVSAARRRVAIGSMLLFGFVVALVFAVQVRQRKDRMAALGALASGMAHEIRNPLNAISIIVQRFEREFTPTEGVHEYRTLAGTVRSEVERVNGIIRQFLEFARPPRLRPQTVALGGFLDEIAGIVASKAAAKGLSLCRESDADATLAFDPEQIKQALLNLLINAIEATSQGGTITLRSIAKRDAPIAIEVRDTGCGIPRELIDRVFDPYFTTKAEGTGMGLSITHRIVAEHNGAIDVESEPGRGTTFRIRLPAT